MRPWERNHRRLILAWRRELWLGSTNPALRQLVQATLQWAAVRQVFLP
ncbi:MAG UNVERIFIED_CONTAM: hypothetical protein LVR29_21225 [Microcystis novacekii LVE1205-3]